MNVFGQIVVGLLWVFVGCMWIRFITDWVQVFARSWSPRGILLVVLEAVYSVTDPPIKALRRLVPPLRIGNFALDLSFLIVFIAAYVLLNVATRALL
ncbi:YggT family protein [Nocardioides dongxiaopingii]|uniref:YggT family protein n=1 Tax=Nocardioides TaxID=1839 RepID=UPI0010C76ACF|nr:MULTISPECIES: YggT family protein [Nocardioides]QCW51167.1 YggT family protein [Nocardioides sp. S-1144]